MNPQTVQATFGCLLYDVGKAVCRAGISDGRHGEAGYRFVRDIDGYGQAKAVLDCIRYHHAAQLRQAKDCDPLAAIACIADNIAAAADRRQTGDETQFDRYLPLSPVFTHLNGEHPGHTLPPHALDGCLRLPLDGSFRLSAGDYEQILLPLRRELSALPPQEEWLNSLLSVWESCMSTVPSSTNTGESPDISLYDHSKVTAAVGACISEYLLDRGETDYFTALVQQEQSFRLQQAFALFRRFFRHPEVYLQRVHQECAEVPAKPLLLSGAVHGALHRTSCCSCAASAGPICSTAAAGTAMCCCPTRKRPSGPSRRGTPASTTSSLSSLACGCIWQTAIPPAAPTI